MLTVEHISNHKIPENKPKAEALIFKETFIYKDN